MIQPTAKVQNEILIPFQKEPSYMMVSVVASYSGETDSGLQWVEESRPSIINFHPHMLATRKKTSIEARHVPTQRPV